MTIALFIFHRDLRYEDNITLNKLIDNENIDKIIPIFNFDPIQILPENNKYFSHNCVQFMCESLIDMDPMPILTYDKLLNSIKNIYNKHKFSYIGFNKDYTVFSIKRDNEIKKWAEDNDIICISEDDALLVTDKILNKTGNIYQKFTPYYKELLKKKPKINKPIIKTLDKLYIINNLNDLTKSDIKKFYIHNDKIAHEGGRTKGKLQLKGAEKIVPDYKNTRDYMKYETTGLSAYIKYGCLSIREIYYKFIKYQDFIRQLYWRDFYYNLGLYLENNYEGAGKNNKSEFNKWKNGETGIEMVDAGMRQLNTTGIMHNRLRMICASYLTKDLKIDWRKGEKYFATKLVDYDPIQNNRNWCYIASITPESQPKFRKFNPERQMLKYDKDKVYINRWVQDE